MKNKFFVGSGVVFLCLFSATLLNLPIMALVLKAVDLFVEVDFFAEAIIRLVVSVMTVAGISGAVCYLVAYRSALFNTSLFLGNFSIAALVQLAISLLLKFATFIAGGTLYLAGLFEHGTGFTANEDIEFIGLIDYLLAFIILSLITVLTSIICGKIGAKKRLKDREELISGNK